MRVSQVAQGQQGIQGPAGPPGTSGGSIYLHDHSTANNGVADATAGVAAAIAAAKTDGCYLVHTGGPNDLWLVTSFVNTWGVEFEGAGKIIQSVTVDGNTFLRQWNSRHDRHRDITGREYLAAYHKLLMAGSASKMVFSGDSTTVGTGLSAPYVMSTAIPAMGVKYGISNITGVNAGHGSKNSGDWLATYLTADLAQNPDLYVLRWGINEYYSDPPFTPDETITNIRTGLAQCRAAKTLAQMSIILMTPTATAYHLNKNERNYEALVLGFKQAARDYGACFFNTYGMYRDAYSGSQTWLDSIRTHPLDVGAMWVNSALSDLIFPSMVRTNG